MRRLALAVVAVLVAACGAGAAVTPSPAPTPTPEPTRSDAEIAAVLSDTVKVVFCGSAPVESWCKSLVKAGKGYQIEVDGTVVLVGSKLADTAAGRKIAMKICTAMAAAHFDADAKDLGVKTFNVLESTASTIIAKCNIPGY